jgi:endonuclease-3
LLVGFGQTICLPVGRKCGDCKLSERGLCPSAVVGKSIKVKKEKIALKSASDVQTALHEELTIKDVKAEDVPDIEDLGK